MITKIPTCPFCWGSLSYPEEIRVNDETVLAGKCFACGARFIVDPTGMNVGEVMVQALGMLAQRLGKNLESLIDGEDYEDCVLSYDVKQHQCLGPPRRYRDGYGRLYVIRCKKKRDD